MPSLARPATSSPPTQPAPSKLPTASLRIAPPRVGNYLTDGVPANTETAVFPVKVAVEITRHFTDGSTRQESKDQTYVFFQDEFGDWTYRFVENN